MPNEASNWQAAGSVGNFAFYRMCADFPSHNDQDAVAQKMLFIARVYSVARGLGKDYEKLAKAVCVSFAELDLLIDRAKERDFPDGMKRVLKCHAFLDDAVCGALKGGNRTVHGRASFCSKYLHFHAPDAFPIYDSFANEGLRSKTPRLRFSGDTPPYTRFCTRFALYLNEHGRGRSLRTIDSELTERGRQRAK